MDVAETTHAFCFRVGCLAVRWCRSIRECEKRRKRIGEKRVAARQFWCAEKRDARVINKKNCVRNRMQGMCRREDGEAMEGNNAALCTLTIHLNRNTEIQKKRIDVVSEVMKPSSSVC